MDQKTRDVNSKANNYEEKLLCIKKNNKFIGYKK